MPDATSALVLHSGGQEVTLEQLDEIRAPEPQGRWYPVAHGKVYRRVKETLGAAGYEVVKEKLAVARKGARFFGVLDLKTRVSDGVSLAVGVRNSTDKSFPLGFCAGNRVFVCDNLAFRSELLIRRKHTMNGERRFDQAIAVAVSSLSSFREEEERRVRLLQGTPLGETLAEALILRAWDKCVIGGHQLSRVLHEWRSPSYPGFEERTAWRLFNAFTAVLTERSVSQPHGFVAQTMQLHHLMEQAV
ncbi:MAG: hypothetical protein U0736_12630 [Gemmataceae bacterium]